MPFEPPFLEPMWRLNLEHIDILLGVGLRRSEMWFERAADWCTNRSSCPRPSEMLDLDADAGLPLSPKDQVSERRMWVMVVVLRTCTLVVSEWARAM